MNIMIYCSPHDMVYAVHTTEAIAIFIPLFYKNIFSKKYWRKIMSIF